MDLPAGGKLTLQTPEEAEMWDGTVAKYKRDYSLSKANDLLLLGAIVTQNLAMFRAQQRLNGMEAVLDPNNVPTGQYRQVQVSVKDARLAQVVILDAAKEIRELEKTLGIDKKTRDAGGGDSVANYLGSLKIAGRQLGVHITKRTKAYEEMAMDLRWRLRVLHHGDEEDKAQHNISERSICDFATKRLAELEEIDKEFAQQKGAIFAGRM